MEVRTISWCGKQKGRSNESAVEVSCGLAPFRKLAKNQSEERARLSREINVEPVNPTVERRFLVVARWSRRNEGWTSSRYFDPSSSLVENVSSMVIPQYNTSVTTATYMRHNISCIEWRTERPLRILLFKIVKRGIMAVGNLINYSNIKNNELSL